MTISGTNSSKALELVDQDGRLRPLVLNDPFDRKRGRGIHHRDGRPLTVEDLDGRTMQGKRISRSMACYENFAEMNEEQRLLVLRLHAYDVAIEDLDVQYLNGGVTPMAFAKTNNTLEKRRDKIKQQLEELNYQNDR